MEKESMRELALQLVPEWRYYIVRPLRMLFDDKITPMMYQTITILSTEEDTLTMTELSTQLHATKQQMTKLVNGLIAENYVERIYDPNDRRVIRLRLSENGKEYLNRFYAYLDNYYDSVFGQLDEPTEKELFQALNTLHTIFKKIPCSNELHDDHSERVKEGKK